MKNKLVLEAVYTLFLGLLLALFIGVGIDTFYPGPTAPEYPAVLNTYVGKNMTPEQEKAQREFDASMNQYNKEMMSYNRNVSIIAVSAAVVLLIISIIFEKRIKFISDGVMTGSLFTLVYGIGRGFASQNSEYVFIVVSIGLVAVIYLGYRYFSKAHIQTVRTTTGTHSQAL